MLVSNPITFRGKSLNTLKEFQSETSQMLKIIFDIETYPNIILFGFKEVGANNPDFVYFSNKKASIINELKTLFERYGTHTLVGYNSRHFDDIIINYALRRATVDGLYDIAQRLIESRYVKPISGITSIDLKAIAGTHFKLKAVGCRLGYHTIDELPFNPLEQCPDIDRLREYLTHDLNLTEQLYLEMEKTVESRLSMGVPSALNRRTPELGTELLLSQIGQQPSSGWVVKPAPDYERIELCTLIEKQVACKTSALQELKQHTLHVVKDKETGKPDYNKWNTKTTIGETEYSVGFGGLHLTRKNYHETDLVDVDVSSYYPTLIRNLNIVPRNLRGSAFVETIKEMLATRLEAKKNPDRKSEAAIAKLVLNSTFGKFGYHRERYLFDIGAMLAVTLNGQLILLELIEQLEAAGYPVITANTDSITFRRKGRGNYEPILRAFEQKWNITFEHTHIKQLVGLDINNYFLIDEHDKIKGRGLFDVFRSFDENKSKQINRIIPRSIVQYYTHGTEPEEFVRQKQHAFTDYINWSSLKVPALWGNEYYTDFTGEGGRVLRWYRSTAELSPIILKRVKGDARLPLSERCRIVLTLPDNRPNDIDYDWYAREARKWIDTIEGRDNYEPITPDTMLSRFAGSGSSAFTKVQEIVSGLKKLGFNNIEIREALEHNILSVVNDDGEYERILNNLLK